MGILICKHCFKNFYVRPYREKTAICCSRSCLWHITKTHREEKRLKSISGKIAYNNKQISKKCINCNNEFKISPSRDGKSFFCSKECYNKIFEKNKNNSKYKFIKIDGKKILEHRFVVEKIINRKLKRNEIVHHINEDKSDNRIENLVMMSKMDHSRLHGKIRDTKYK